MGIFLPIPARYGKMSVRLITTLKFTATCALYLILNIAVPVFSAAPPDPPITISPVYNATSPVYCDHRFFWAESDAIFFTSYHKSRKTLLFRTEQGRIGTLVTDSPFLFWSTDYGELWRMNLHTDSIKRIKNKAGFITSIYAANSTLYYTTTDHNCTAHPDARCARICKTDYAGGSTQIILDSLPHTISCIAENGTLYLCTISSTAKTIREINQSNQQREETETVYKLFVVNESLKTGPERLLILNRFPKLFAGDSGSVFVSSGNSFFRIKTTDRKPERILNDINVFAFDGKTVYGGDSTGILQRRHLSTPQLFDTLSIDLSANKIRAISIGSSEIGIWDRKTLRIVRKEK
jgi:hypothetical protein